MTRSLDLIDSLKRPAEIRETRYSPDHWFSVLGWPRRSFSFFHTMALVVLSCLSLHSKRFC